MMLSVKEHDFPIQDTFECSLRPPAGTDHIHAVFGVSDVGPACFGVSPPSAAGAPGATPAGPGKLVVVWCAATTLALVVMILIKWFH